VLQPHRPERRAKLIQIHAAIVAGGAYFPVICLWTTAAKWSDVAWANVAAPGVARMGTVETDTWSSDRWHDPWTAFRPSHVRQRSQEHHLTRSAEPRTPRRC
jgi:hypothetical protein